MKTSRMLFWGSFLGAIVAVLAIVAFFDLRDSNRMGELSRFYADWPVVVGKVNGFEARLPEEGKYATDDLTVPGSEQVIRQEIYVASSKSASYFISAVLYPEDLTGDEEENLRTALEGMMQTIPDAEALSSQYVVPFSGGNYLEFEFRDPSTAIFYKGRIHVAGRSMYQIYSSYPEASYDDDEYTYFVHSFLIT